MDNQNTDIQLQTSEIQEVTTPSDITLVQSEILFGLNYWIKLAVGILGIFGLGVGIFFAINSYEDYNGCSFKGFSCETIPITFPQKSHRDCGDSFGCTVPFKPLILLYPKEQTEVQVQLEYISGFFATFPEYDNSKKGWSVTAYPDATLLDHTTGQETYGLFWEGNATNIEYDLSKGWIVKGSEIREFLYEKLTAIGLNTKEKSDFIMFWYPKLQHYPYIQITFAGEDYEQSAPLQIAPEPDSLLRVFMVAKPLEKAIDIAPQALEKFERKGFTAVEWGGTVLE